MKGSETRTDYPTSDGYFLPEGGRAMEGEAGGGPAKPTDEELRKFVTKLLGGGR